MVLLLLRLRRVVMVRWLLGPGGVLLRGRRLRGGRDGWCDFSRLLSSTGFGSFVLRISSSTYCTYWHFVLVLGLTDYGKGHCINSILALGDHSLSRYRGIAFESEHVGLVHIELLFLNADAA